MSRKPLPGFRDFYPDEFAERAHIFHTWRRVVRRYAFQEYDGPPLEPLELYTQKSGEEIVTQLYNFVDKGNRQVALRPEMTPTIARMVAARAQTLRKPVRWFSIPQLFRYERTQKGRLREHFQLNVDIIGESNVLADAELLSVAVEIMRALGLGPSDIRARVSDRELLNGILADLGVAASSWATVYQVLDKIARQPLEVSAEKLAAAGLSADVTETILGLGSMDWLQLKQRFAGSPAAGPHVERLECYFRHCSALGIADWMDLDLSIVRGLAYYTGIVFELFDTVGEFRAVCGGGRYDTLLKSLGGTDMPALGFGMGDVVLGELLKSRGLMPARQQELDYWGVEAPDAEDAPQAALSVAAQLRLAGCMAEYSLHPQRTDKQVEAGRKAGAGAFVIVEHEGSTLRFRVRRSGHEDLTFNTPAALVDWASTVSEHTHG